MTSRRHLLGALAAAPGWLATAHADTLDATLARLQRAWQPRLAWRPDPAWRDAALATARSLILRPGDDGRDLAPATVETEDRGGHTAQRLTLCGALGDRVPALLLMPRGPGPHPAVLALHDHGARFDMGKEKLVRPIGPAPAAQAWAERYFDGRFVGDALVEAGFAVLAIDALGWGERSRPRLARDDQQALASDLMQLGQSWAGIIASDDLRAHRWLREQPGIDPRRVAVLGFSMGALRAWQLAAVCEPVWACVAAHWMCTREALLRPGEHTRQGQSSFAMLHPGLAAELDHPDVAALVAPRPLMLLGSPDDTLFPWDGVQQAWARLRPAWAASGALRTVATPGGHRFGIPQQQAAIDWLQAQPPA